MICARQPQIDRDKRFLILDGRPRIILAKDIFNVGSDEQPQEDGSLIKPKSVSKKPRPTTNDAMLPVIDFERSRIANILANDPAVFSFKHNPEADSSSPWWEIHELGFKAVQTHNRIITEMADKHEIDPDLIRAIMYMENARGHKFGIDRLAESVSLSDTIMPMNINPAIWGPLLDRPARGLKSPRDNIEAAVILLKRIQQRITDPTIEAIASVWNFVGREKTNDIGAYVGRVYIERPWEKEPGFGLPDHPPAGML